MSRRETGVLQDLGDWPGIFIRGDEALGLANECRKLAELADTSKFARSQFERIAALLEQCKQ